jgi:hypothetical protein
LIGVEEGAFSGKSKAIPIASQILQTILNLLPSDIGQIAIAIANKAAKRNMIA